MASKHQLSPQSRAQLQQAARQTQDAGMARRATALLMYLSTRKSHRTVAKEMAMSKDTLRRALRRFEQQGVTGLATKPHGGSPPRVRHLVTAVIEDIVHQSPRNFGFHRSVWTLDSLADCLQQHFDIHAGPECVRRALLEKGYRWSRAKRTISSPDPDYHHKRGRSTNSSTNTPLKT